MAHTIVVALGGNALGNTPQEQLELLKNTAKPLVDLIEKGERVVITHGNGPQVGMIKVATDKSAALTGETPTVPFAECGAMSQGYIGYGLQQAIDGELRARGIKGKAVSLVSQTLVDSADAAFQNPTKPVGAFFTQEQAEKLAAETGDTYVEDSGRGYRRVVASPVPIEILESSVVKDLVNAGYTVVSTGGGGVPVVKEGKGYKGVDAVIDKDRTAALLAKELDADLLLILTAVEQVYIGFNTPNQKALSEITSSQAREYIENGEFARGSMLPKVEACLDFVEGNLGKKAVITSLQKAGSGINGETGTTLTA